MFEQNNGGKTVFVCLCSAAIGYLVCARRRQKKVEPREVAQPKPLSKALGVCVVTGGSRGIGAAICKKLANKYSNNQYA